MWGGERLQGWAFKAMSLNCILAKWDEWCFLIRLLTAFALKKEKEKKGKRKDKTHRDGARELNDI